MGIQQTVTVYIDGVTFDVTGTYWPGSKTIAREYADGPDDPAYFEVDSVCVNGMDLTSLLTDEAMVQIEELAEEAAR